MSELISAILGLVTLRNISYFGEKGNFIHGSQLQRLFSNPDNCQSLAKFPGQEPFLIVLRPDDHEL